MLSTGHGACGCDEGGPPGSAMTLAGARVFISGAPRAKMHGVSGRRLFVKTTNLGNAT